MRKGAVGARANPMIRGSADASARSAAPSILLLICWTGLEIDLSDCESSVAGGPLCNLSSGDVLSSLLGGVLKGDTFASTEGRLWLCSGRRLSGSLWDGLRGIAVTVGAFAGIFGFSARLMDGGFGAVCTCAGMKAAIF